MRTLAKISIFVLFSLAIDTRPSDAVTTVKIQPKVEGRFLDLPQRQDTALSGSEFIYEIKNKSGEAREQAILREVLSGNVPAFMRKLVAVKTKVGTETLKFWTMPDYLAIGSEVDFVRIPMMPKTAQMIARKLGLSLPTTKLVNLIHAKSKFKLRPQPLKPSRLMVTSQYFLKHDQLIGAQLSPLAHGQLTAGHKKDIVLSQRLTKLANRVAIYGWHYPNGRVIQPLSLVHGDDYVDYSHGVRFVSSEIEVSGQSYSIKEILADGKLASLVSDEGKLSSNLYALDNNR